MQHQGLCWWTSRVLWPRPRLWWFPDSSVQRGVGGSLYGSRLASVCWLCSVSDLQNTAAITHYQLITYGSPIAQLDVELGVVYPGAALRLCADCAPCRTYKTHQLHYTCLGPPFPVAQLDVELGVVYPRAALRLCADCAPCRTYKTHQLLHTINL